MTQRVKWWDNYDDPVPVIVGHYWRRYNQDRRTANGGKQPGLCDVIENEGQNCVVDKGGCDVFEGIEPREWLGKCKNVYCIDFSVGGRSAERLSGRTPPYDCKLAALRVPEWKMVHDDGEVWSIGKPGK